MASCRHTHTHTEQHGVDLTTRHPQLREIANTIKTAQRGITNFAQDEIGVVESRDNVGE